MNRLRRDLFCLLITLAGTAASTEAQQKPGSAPRSTLGGVFTTEQARRGEMQFRAGCANCHSVREFTSPGIFRAWNGRPIRELFEMIRSLMPDDNPGGLAKQAYVDVLAYLLAENGYPAGTTDLPSDEAELGKIRIEVEAGSTAGR